MPIKGAKYRVKTTKHGKKVRLAFKDDEIVETKNLKTHKMHTMEEFMEDKQRKHSRGYTGSR